MITTDPEPITIAHIAGANRANHQVSAPEGAV